MKRIFTLLIALSITGTAALAVCGAEPVEDFLRDLPPGVFIESSTVVDEVQADAIGQKLGGGIEKLTNTMLLVHGRQIQINAVTAVDEAAAEVIHSTLSSFKKYPFCFRNGRIVIEYVGRFIDKALAVKTSWELGLLDKPESVRYRISADLITVDKMDYMVSNRLFNKLLASEGGTDSDKEISLSELMERFEYGNTLKLRDPELDAGSCSYHLQPAAASVSRSRASVSYTFDKLPDRHGIPFVSVVMEITVRDTGSYAGGPPAADLTDATSFWPSDEETVISLAKDITKGRRTADAKVDALLEWLTPGKNLKFEGQTGSRWGTMKVLEQRFGHCWDFSDCFMTLARAAGVPCRQVAGWLYGSSGHVWAEYYLEGEGWQQVDPTGGGRLECGIYHIPWFTTEDGEMPIQYAAIPEIEFLPPE